MATGKNEGRSLFDITPEDKAAEPAAAAETEMQKPAPRFDDVINSLTEDEAKTFLAIAALLEADSSEEGNTAEMDAARALSIFEGAEVYDHAIVENAAAKLKEMAETDPEALDRFFDITFTAFIFSYIKAQGSKGTAEEKKKRTDAAFNSMMLLMADMDMGTAFYNYVMQRTGAIEKRKKATPEGNTTEIGERLTLLTDDYFDALKPSTKGPGIFTRTPSGIKVSAAEADLGFLLAIETIVTNDFKDNPDKYTEGSTPVYRIALKDFLEKTGHDATQKLIKDNPGATRADAREHFINTTLAAMDSLWGYNPADGKEYKIITERSYDPKTEIVEIEAPFYHEIIKAHNREVAAKQEASHKYIPAESTLIHTKAANTRNKPAFEMAMIIINGLENRGTYTKERDGKIKYNISAAGLVRESAMMKEKIKKAKDANSQNQIYKYAFTALKKILVSNTDIIKAYINAEITVPIPTTTTLKITEITITHYGRNPDYKKPPKY